MAAPPSKTDKTNASKQCRAERGETSATQEAFAAKYGTNESKSNAFGKCVSQMDAEDRKVRTEQRNAAKACAEERGTTAATSQAFADKYGTNKNKKNAFGKCVSQKASAPASA